MDDRDERKGIQSVEIAFRLLAALQAGSGPQPLKDIAGAAGLSRSAASNYLVSLVRTGMAAADARQGHYRLGPAAVALGMRAIQQIDGLGIVNAEAVNLRDATGLSTAVTAWSDDGPVSLFKQDGHQRGAWEMRTGLVPILATAAGRAFIACLPLAATRPLIEREALEPGQDAPDAAEYRALARRELERDGYAAVFRADMSGYASVAAPVWDWGGEIRFALSLVGRTPALDARPDSPQVRALLRHAGQASVGLGGRPPF